MQPGGVRYQYYACLPEIRKTPTCPSNGKKSRFWRADAIEPQARDLLAKVLRDLNAPEHRLLLRPRLSDPRQAERAALQEQHDALLDMRQRGRIDENAFELRRQVLIDRLAEVTGPEELPVQTAATAARSVPDASNVTPSDLLDDWGVTFGLDMNGRVYVMALRPR